MQYTPLLRVSHHGGRCCGVKHIHEFPSHPTVNLYAYNGKQKYGGNAYTQMVEAGKRFFCLRRPAETALKRLDATLQSLKEKQPKGLVEVVLSRTIADKWREALLERGFKEGPVFKNSNTYATLCVFWLVNGGNSNDQR